MASTVSASIPGLTSDEGLHLRGERRSLLSQVDSHYGVYHRIGSRQRQSSIIYFPIIYLLAYYYLSSISLSSLYHLSHPSVYHLYLLTSLSLPIFSPFHLSWLSQSPITGCYQPLSIFCQIWFTCIPSMITYLSSPIIYLRIVLLFACHSFSAICDEDAIPLNSPSCHFLLSFDSPS